MGDLRGVVDIFKALAECLGENLNLNFDAKEYPLLGALLFTYYMVYS
jgi:hypothetical protein